jgi:chromosomal replication initiation ATPase DnaA
MKYPEHIKLIASHYHISAKMLLNGPREGMTKKARWMLAWYYREKLGMSYPEINKLLDLPNSSIHRNVEKINERITSRDKFTILITKLL